MIITIPRLIVLAVYVLLLISAAGAAIQTRKLSALLPSRSWKIKRGAMFFFVGVQVYGFVQNVAFGRQASWLGALYFVSTLIFLLMLNWSDYELLRDNKQMREYVSQMQAEELSSGEQSVEEWRKGGLALVKEAIYESVKPEYLIGR